MRCGDPISELIGTPGTEFVKMRHDSRYSRIGTFWRFMALNDNRFEVVTTGDVDDEDEFCMPVDSLKAMTRGGRLFGSVLFLREEMEYLSSERASFNIFLESDLHGDAIFIESISSLNRFGGKEIARGDCSLPDMVKLICAYLASAPMQKLYNPASNRWALFHEREPRVGASELGFMNEFFPRFLTKVMPTRQLITKERHEVFSRINNKYGEDCLLNRLYQQLSDEGHEIVTAFSGPHWYQPSNWIELYA